MANLREMGIQLRDQIVAYESCAALVPYTPPTTATNGTPVWKPENSSMPTP